MEFPRIIISQVTLPCYLLSLTWVQEHVYTTHSSAQSTGNADMYKAPLPLQNNWNSKKKKKQKKPSFSWSPIYLPFNDYYVLVLVLSHFRGSPPNAWAYSYGYSLCQWKYLRFHSLFMWHGFWNPLHFNCLPPGSLQLSVLLKCFRGNF